MSNQVIKEENITVEQLLAGAEKIGKLAEQEAQEAEKNATISKNVVNLIKETQISRLLLPKKYGGPQIDFSTFAKIIRKVGYYNMSAAWLTYFYPLHNTLPSFLSQAGMDEIANDGGLICDVFAPVGKAEKDGNGYRISGKWNFASGVLYSGWIGLGLLMEFSESTGPEFSMAVMRTSEVEVLKNWDTLGLRGSGSNTVIADNVYVPMERILRIDKVLVELGRTPEADYDQDYPFYHKPFFSAFYIGFPNMALGGAERLLKEFKDRTEKRTRIFQGGVSEKESSRGQRVLAELTIKYKAADGLMKQYIDLLENHEQAIGPGEFAAIRATIIQYCAEIANKVLTTLGGNAISKGDIVELHTRDIITIATHMTSLYEDAMAAYGQNLFGYPTTVVKG
ncbi:acyl-CoA dehydrogenase family protein [Bacillus sp. EB600]|uniref:acyl-CoA dehydrogenase family protein n=1 Tax=Bacillus sp. EB600 TaxID=2806345 RepID=UPI00210EBD67|nr:acyl-CoA dehydrogenase family protein [Bacillus sp. EB600]MCQ6282285.1 acyl-CoA dehydrogenase [Bacillus sp. EB600]